MKAHFRLSFFCLSAIAIVVAGCGKSENVADNSVATKPNAAAANPVAAQINDSSTADNVVESSDAMTRPPISKTVGDNEPKPAANNASRETRDNRPANSRSGITGLGSNKEDDSATGTTELVSKSKKVTLPPPAEPSGKTGTDPGDTIMEIAGEDVDGEEFALSDYEGKVVMLDFWGDW